MIRGNYKIYTEQVALSTGGAGAPRSDNSPYFLEQNTGSSRSIRFFTRSQNGKNPLSAN